MIDMKAVIMADEIAKGVEALLEHHQREINEEWTQLTAKVFCGFVYFHFYINACNSILNKIKLLLNPILQRRK